MAWYGHDALPFAMLVPAAAAGLLLPYIGRRVDPKLAALGNIIAFSGLASLLTQAGLGMSVLGTIWALAGLFALSDVGLHTLAHCRQQPAYQNLSCSRSRSC